MDYLALKNEILNDPKGLGYVGKSDLEIAEMLNTKGLSSEYKDAESLSSQDLFVLSPAEYDSLSSSGKQQLDFLIKAGTVPVNEKTKEWLKLIFPAKILEERIDPLLKRAISRVESLEFGSLTHEDVIKALEYLVTKYRVSQKENPNEWINKSISPQGTTYIVECCDGYYEVTTIGILPSPAEEIK